MEIKKAIKILYKDYEREPTEGCLDRAIILWFILKSKNIDSKIKHFIFKNNKGEEITHHIVVSKDRVYDCNEEVTSTRISEYKEKKKTEFKDSETFIRGNCFAEKSLEYLLKNFKSYPEFLKEVELLIYREQKNFPFSLRSHLPSTKTIA